LRQSRENPQVFRSPPAGMIPAGLETGLFRNEQTTKDEKSNENFRVLQVARKPEEGLTLR